ncbi:MAG: ATP-binding protein, partial [Lachnospiraceae bacterium]|nr:ATP-binding protein [Lachnospiraceae bacterium]
FTQKDVRELQLAKSAVRAGMEVLIAKYGITAEDLAAVYIAGGFGFYLNMEKASAIGLISQELLTVVKAAGNTSLQGAVLALTDPQAIVQMPKIAQMAEEIPLASDPMFTDLYMEHMMFGEEM